MVVVRSLDSVVTGASLATGVRYDLSMFSHWYGPIENPDGPTPKCETCRFMAISESVPPRDDGRLLGQCRRMSKPESHFWPVVLCDEDWCGQHETRRPVDASGQNGLRFPA